MAEYKNSLKQVFESERQAGRSIQAFGLSKFRLKLRQHVMLNSDVDGAIFERTQTNSWRLAGAVFKQRAILSGLAVERRVVGIGTHCEIIMQSMTARSANLAA